MACLQMTNNSLTVKFHYLRCFEPLRLEIAVPAYFPSQESTSLGNVEYFAVELSVASLLNPHSNEGSSTTSAARKRGKYQHYSAETCAKIGKYASANGNSKAINHFKEELPTLKESTVRTFKRA